jgi:integrase
MGFEATDDTTPSIVNSSVARTREYLTAAEIERLMATARKSSRHGHRDATMILIAYRHSLRASELCDLQWHQVELHHRSPAVRRSKRGTPSVHPMQGDEISPSARRLRQSREKDAPWDSRPATLRASVPVGQVALDLITPLGHNQRRTLVLYIDAAGVADGHGDGPGALLSTRLIRRASAIYQDGSFDVCDEQDV